MKCKAQKGKSQPEAEITFNTKDYDDGQGNNVCSGDASMHELQSGRLVKAVPSK
jgi:hypothetical protein